MLFIIKRKRSESEKSDEKHSKILNTIKEQKEADEDENEEALFILFFNLIYLKIEEYLKGKNEDR